jgi:hypothetical protein
MTATPWACAIAFLALAWAVSGLSPVPAQTDGVPNEKALKECKSTLSAALRLPPALWRLSKRS